MTARASQSQCGTTLVELLAALAVGGIASVVLLVSLATASRSAKRGASAAQADASLQQAYGMLRHDLRQATFWRACASRQACAIRRSRPPGAVFSTGTAYWRVRRGLERCAVGATARCERVAPGIVAAVLTIDTVVGGVRMRRNDAAADRQGQPVLATLTLHVGEGRQRALSVPRPQP